MNKESLTFSLTIISDFYWARVAMVDLVPTFWSYQHKSSISLARPKVGYPPQALPL